MIIFPKEKAFLKTRLILNIYLYAEAAVQSRRLLEGCFCISKYSNIPDTVVIFWIFPTWWSQNWYTTSTQTHELWNIQLIAYIKTDQRCIEVYSELLLISTIGTFFGKLVCNFNFKSLTIATRRSILDAWPECLKHFCIFISKYL